MTERSVRFKILLLFFLALTNLRSIGQTYPDQQIDSLLSEGVHNLIVQDYSRAYQTYESLNKLYPELPVGKIFLAGTSMSESFDLGIEFKTDLIDSLLKAALLISQKLIDIEDENPWYYYFAGLSYGFEGYNNALNGNFIDAFFNGYSSLGYFENCLILDNRFYEARIPIGTYLYWKTDKSIDLSWLPFFPDKKEEGIEFLSSAADSAGYLKYFADYSLMWIYYNEEEYEKSVHVSVEFLSEYPESRLFQIGLAKSLRFIDKPRAIKIFSDLVNSYRNLRYNNHLQEILMLKMLAELYLETGEYEMALETCNDALLLNDLEPFVVQASSERLKSIEELKRKAQELLTDN